MSQLFLQKILSWVCQGHHKMQRALYREEIEKRQILKNKKHTETDTKMHSAFHNCLRGNFKLYPNVNGPLPWLLQFRARKRLCSVAPPTSCEQKLEKGENACHTATRRFGSCSFRLGRRVALFTLIITSKS